MTVSHATIAVEPGPHGMSSDGFHPDGPVYGTCGQVLALHLGWIAAR